MLSTHTLHTYLIAKNGAVEEYPFDETTRVYKVCGKMFALYDEVQTPLSINLKCDPFFALVLREQYPYITAGYHMNKKHWNTVKITDECDDELLRNLIDDSYELVVSGLTKKQRELLG